MKMKTTLTVLAAVALLLAGCNMPGSTPATPTNSPDSVMTAAAATVAVQLTANEANRPTDTPTPEPTETPEPSPTVAAATATLRPTTAPQTGANTACDSAVFVSDVTVQDGASMAPGQTFAKTWRLSNGGTCTWTTAYKVIFASGDIMGGPTEQNLTASVGPGQTIDITVNLTAPTTAARYQGNWLLRNASGANFGIQGSAPFWVIINVTGSGSPTVTVTPGGPTATTGPTATNSPSVYSSASGMSVSETGRVDLDLGVVSPAGGGYDFEFAVSGSNKSLTPINGATFAVWGATAPTLANCTSATLGAGAIAISSGSVGQHLCFRTNDGRYGFMKILNLTPSDAAQVQTLEFSYSTYGP